MKRWARRHPFVLVMIVVTLAWIVPQGLVFTPPRLVDFAVSLMLGVMTAITWDLPRRLRRRDRRTR